jgi:hypothetical protein
MDQTTTPTTRPDLLDSPDSGDTTLAARRVFETAAPTKRTPITAPPTKQVNYEAGDPLTGITRELTDLETFTSQETRIQDLHAQVSALSQEMATLMAIMVKQHPSSTAVADIQGGANSNDVTDIQGGAPATDVTVIQGGANSNDVTVIQGGAPANDVTVIQGGAPTDVTVIQGDLPATNRHFSESYKYFWKSKLECRSLQHAATDQPPPAKSQLSSANQQPSIFSRNQQPISSQQPTEILTNVHLGKKNSATNKSRQPTSSQRSVANQQPTINSQHPIISQKSASKQKPAARNQ